MFKYLLLLLALNQAAHASYASDLDQENVDPWAQLAMPENPAAKKSKLTTSQTSLNLLSEAGSGATEVQVSEDLGQGCPFSAEVRVPEHEKYTKYYDRIILENFSAAGKLEVLIERDFPITSTGEVFPASCLIRLDGKLIGGKTQIVEFLEQSDWGQHDIYNLIIKDQNETMKAVIKIPTLVENLSNKDGNADLGSEITFLRADGQEQLFPLKVRTLMYKKS